MHLLRCTRFVQGDPSSSEPQEDETTSDSRSSSSSSCKCARAASKLGLSDTPSLSWSVVVHERKWRLPCCLTTGFSSQTLPLISA